jgi:hypothetical protein
MKLIEIWYYIWATPYYKVTVINDMEKIKEIIQPVISKTKGYNIAIVDKKLKMAWWKIDGICFRDGKKFLMTVDINNAIPLIEKKKVETSGDLLIKEISMSQMIEENVDLRNEKSGKGKNFVKIEYPPTVLFQEIEALFVKEVISEPPNKWEALGSVLTVLVIAVAAIVIFFLWSHGSQAVVPV